MSTITHLQVELLQSSNKRDPNLKVNHQETNVSDKVIKFYHTENYFSKMIRAYIDSVTSTIFFLFHFYIISFFLYTLSVMSFQTNINIYKRHMLKLNLLAMYYLFILISFIYDINYF